jgi:Cd2+/Zn2+-exporting ATPase
MGGLGSDIALNAADVVLMHDNLQRIPQLMRLGKRTNRIIQANLYFAAGVIICLTLFSITGKLPLPIAVIGHEGSTVVVILNGLRVLRGP